jgi:predicted DNA-binding WGR domain protein
MTKWCLLKTSDGARGANDKKKVYEVTLDGSTVRTSWGMAEKSARQSATVVYYSEGHARQEAMVKVQEKLGKGYVLAYTV